MNNYRDLFEIGYSDLERAGIAEAKLDARLLLEYVCGTDHSTLLAHPDRPVSDLEEKQYREYIKRRSKREPVAYILGKWDFMGLTFEVSGDVLIPEQDTEILVEEAMRFCEDGMRILDLCTGSGCIGLSLLNYTNSTSAVCTDISEAALNIAGRNAANLGFRDRAEFVKTDLFPDEKGGKFDIIVSNPPYIKKTFTLLCCHGSVIKQMSPECQFGNAPCRNGFSLYFFKAPGFRTLQSA